MVVSTELIEKHGPVDVLIMNAGYMHQGTIEESTPAEIQKQFDTNVFGLVSFLSIYYKDEEYDSNVFFVR